MVNQAPICLQQDVKVKSQELYRNFVKFDSALPP